MSISLFTFQQLCCLIVFCSESEVEEKLRLELKRVTKRANKKWHSERKQRFKTKHKLYTVVETCVTEHAMPMWVSYSLTQRAETYLVNQETILARRRHKQIPVKSMSKGTLDGLFYPLKYDFSTTFEQFMDSIGNIKFEYASDYTPSDNPWFSRYPSTYVQQGQKQLGAYEGFINGWESIVLEQMGFLLSKKLRFLNDKFTADKSKDLSTFNSCNVQDKNNYLHLASK